MREWRVENKKENLELMELFLGEPDIVAQRKMGRLRWFGTLGEDAMRGEYPPKTVKRKNPGGRRILERPRLRCRERPSTQVGVRRWTPFRVQTATDGENLLRSSRSFFKDCCIQLYGLWLPNIVTNKTAR